MRSSESERGAQSSGASGAAEPSGSSGPSGHRSAAPRTPLRPGGSGRPGRSARADRVGRALVPYAYLLPTLVLLVVLVPPLAFGQDWGTWIYRGLALLLIGCPCALVISVPASIASALSTGARRGLLMKGGAVIEAAAKVSKVAFDKTGTLTHGRPQVTDLVPFGHTTEAQLL